MKFFNLKSLSDGEYKMGKIHGFGFCLVITVISWLTFRYNWALMLPVFVGTGWLYQLLFDRFRVFRYIVAAMSCLVWGMLGLALGLFLYFSFKNFHWNPGWYFVVMISLAFYYYALRHTFMQFRKENNRDEEISKEKLLKNRLGMVTLIVSGVVYIVTIILIFRQFDVT